MVNDSEKRVLMKGLRDNGLSGEVECPQWIEAYAVFKEKTEAPPQAFIDVILAVLTKLITPDCIMALIKQLIGGKQAGKPKPGPTPPVPPNPGPTNG